MRGQEDLVLIKITMTSIVSLDRERIVEDPVWAAIADQVDLNDPEQREQALFAYLSSYITRGREQLFDGVFMPSTNGPADLSIEKLEDVSNGNSTNSGNTGN